MGKPMGRHPYFRYISPKTEKSLKRGRDPAISSLTCTPSSTSFQSPKIRLNMTKDPQNLVKGQHALNTHM
jgi:hypothetical protein